MAGGGGTKDWWWHDGKITYFNTIIDKVITGEQRKMGKIDVIEGKKVTFLEFIAIKHKKMWKFYEKELEIIDPVYRDDRATVLRDMMSCTASEINFLEKALSNDCAMWLNESIFLVNETGEIVKVLE